MKIKTKLTLGVGLLFIMIVLLAGLGIIYNIVLSNDTRNILADNYNSLEYTRNMLLAMDDKNELSDPLKTFEENLIKQEHNITEIGEQELTNQLRSEFNSYQKNPGDSLVNASIHRDIYAIMRLNMDAIQRKSKVAIQTSKTANLWITVTGTLCFLFAFSLLINFPGGIANPIKLLTESIRQIANKNYSERLHFESGDEFGDLASSFNTMAAKLQEYEINNVSKLLFDKKRIETLINNMPDPIIGLDEDKRILFVNNEATKILNMNNDSLVGKTAQDISLVSDLMRTLTKDLVLQSKFEKTNKTPLKIYADNKESYFEKNIINVTVVPTGETMPKHIGDVIILQNITSFKELDFAKTNFIATVSHELKTPISSILMSLKLLEDKRVGEINMEQQQLVHSIKEDSQRLLKITGELTNMTQVETGKIQLSLQSTSAKEITMYALEATKSQADQAKVKVEVNCPENLPKISADGEKTAWVLTNLLSNAIRYSLENSKIDLIVRQSGKQVEFIVHDYGKGIDSKYKDKLFDRYFQVPGSNKTGTGLGLAISKEFIEAQGGKIELESEIGVGSKFSFKLNPA